MVLYRPHIQDPPPQGGRPLAHPGQTQRAINITSTRAGRLLVQCDYCY